MKSFGTLFQWLLLLVIISNTASAARERKIQKLPLLRGGILQESDTILASEIPKDLKTYFFDQTLDHFNYNPQSYTTFKQRYVISFEHWGGAKSNAPIFAYLGAEAAIDNDLRGIGFLPENAPRFKALQVYMEHRFYGKSNPLGSMEVALKNDTVRGYFNSAQALADYAQILVYLKNKFLAQNSPIIVVGASYGGMLASWFRLKYPHIAHGALASSAPILYFDDITPEDAYYSLATKDFKEVSDSCYKTIKRSWSEIDTVASRPNGLSFLSKKFKTCTPLKDSSELKDYLDTMYAVAAQYNAPPTYPVTVVCGGIDRASNGTDILGRIYAGVVAYRPSQTCHETKSPPSETRQGWTWQICSEMVMPIARGRHTMFPPSTFNLTEYSKECNDYFGVQPRPHWVTTYYGGHDIKSILKKFGSNIIFSNGLRDPYSSAGILENISDTVVALSTANGSHCLDVVFAKPTDPQWLVTQRKTEVQIIEGWIKNFYAALHPTNK